MARHLFTAIAVGAWLGFMPTPCLAASPPDHSTFAVRDDDLRVASVAFRIAIAGQRRCPELQRKIGLVFQVIDEFAARDRTAAINVYGLDQGPGVAVVVPDGPGDAAGVKAGDILLSIDGVGTNDRPVSDVRLTRQSLAQAQIDRLDDRLDAAAATGSVSLELRRDGTVRQTVVYAVKGCPSRVQLARSDQLDGFADGRHVFITTGLLRRLANDDELALVIAHEMAHNILHHAALLRTARAGGGGGHSALVRQTEDAADLLGADLARDAGYDVVRALPVLKLADHGLDALNPFATHRGAQARARAIQDHLAAEPAR